MDVVDMIMCVVMRVHIRYGGVGGWVFVPCVFWGGVEAGGDWA